MNDRELLVLAAKAAGIEISQWSNCQAGGFISKGSPYLDSWGDERTRRDFWNPLTDDGDAMRLAVKLELEICFNNQEEGTTVWCPAIGDWLPEKHGDDPYAATRRAIVRAAAEIGRTM